MRFKITWHSPEANGSDYTGYKVSVPNYDGGEVVTLDEVQEIERRADEDLKNLALTEGQRIEVLQKSVEDLAALLNQRDKQLKQFQAKLRELRASEESDAQSASANN